MILTYQWYCCDSLSQGTRAGTGTGISISNCGSCDSWEVGMVLLVGVGVPRIALMAGQNWTVHRQGPRGPFSNVSTACESPCDIDWNSLI